MIDSKLAKLYQELRRLGFKRTTRNSHNSDNCCHVYKRQEGKLEIEVQVWTDQWRVLHSWGGYHVVPPTGFDDAMKLEEAIGEQRSKAVITEKHARSHQPEGVYDGQLQPSS